MNAKFLLGAMFLVGACGGSESDEGAVSIEKNGEMTEVSVLDLTADGRTYAIDVRDDGGVAIDLKVQTRRGSFTLVDWMKDIKASHNLVSLSSDDGTLIIISNANDAAEDGSPTALSRAAREQAGSSANCPEECMHCPEDNAFLCQTMCGARH